MDYSTNLVECQENLSRWQSPPHWQEPSDWQEQRTWTELARWQEVGHSPSRTNPYASRYNNRESIIDLRSSASDWRSHFTHTVNRPSANAILQLSWHEFALSLRKLSGAFDTVDRTSSTAHKTPGHADGARSVVDKRPPTATPSTVVGKRKRVSFADDRGLALTTVQLIYDPISPYLSWNNDTYPSIRHALGLPSSDIPRLVSNFPKAAKDDQTIREKLESASVLLGHIAYRDCVISGEILVKNIAYEKTVFVRYSTSNWKHFSDVPASYVARTEPKFEGCDAFSFQFPASFPLEIEDRLEFAICYVINGKEFWDNNDGRNYEVARWRVVGRASPAADRDELSSRCHNTTDSNNAFDKVHPSIVWTRLTGWKGGVDCNTGHW